MIFGIDYQYRPFPPPMLAVTAASLGITTGKARSYWGGTVGQMMEQQQGRMALVTPVLKKKIR